MKEPFNFFILLDFVLAPHGSKNRTMSKSPTPAAALPLLTYPTNQNDSLNSYATNGSGYMASSALEPIQPPIRTRGWTQNV